MEPSRTVTVTRDDGRMDLFVWTPADGRGPAILLIQEIFGVGPYIRAVAARLAASGYVVAAPDLFWRFAPGWSSTHDEEGLAASMQQVANLDPALAVADCLAAFDVLEGSEEAVGVPAVMGFCLGGTVAFGMAVHGSPSACVSYYGSGVPGMLDVLDQVTCPTLFHFGNQDAYIPNEGVDALASAIAGREEFVLNVEAAGHAFDNHESEMFWNEAAAGAAWAKTVAFLSEHLPVR